MLKSKFSEQRAACPANGYQLKHRCLVRSSKPIFDVTHYRERIFLRFRLQFVAKIFRVVLDCSLVAPGYSGMVRKSRTVHVDKITNTVKGVTYTSYYLRRTFRQDGKVKHETLGNLSDLPLAVIDLIRRSLKGETFVPASEVFETSTQSPMGTSKRS